MKMMTGKEFQGLYVNEYVQGKRLEREKGEEVKEKRAFFVFIGVHHTYHDNLVQRLIKAKQTKTIYLYKREHGLSSLFSFSSSFFFFSSPSTHPPNSSQSSPSALFPSTRVSPNRASFCSPVKSTLLSESLRLQLRHILLRQQPRITLALPSQQPPKRIGPIQQIHQRAVLQRQVPHRRLEQRLARGPVAREAHHARGP